MKLKICNQACDQCLFTDNRIVSDERANQIIEQCLIGDKYFECHKGTIKGERIICRSFWNRHKKDVLSLRMALVFGMYEFVEV